MTTILVPFGPTRAVPPGYRWCFACDGANDGPNCEVCGGKGHWNADDIERYHAKFPHICRASCGATHQREEYVSEAQRAQDAEVIRAWLAARKDVG